ncbi:MAG: hypothetical protein AB7L13_13360 [Acidimicrobiia bacterium]
MTIDLTADRASWPAPTGPPLAVPRVPGRPRLRPFLPVVVVVALALCLSGLSFAALSIALALVLVATSILFAPPRSAMATAAAVCAALALAVTDVSRMPLEGRLWGYAGVAVCLSPFVVFPLRRIGTFPYLHVFMLIQGAYLYVTVTLAAVPPYYAARYSDAYRVQGLRMMFWFVALMVVVASALQSRGASRARMRQTQLTVAPLARSSVRRAVAVLIIGRVTVEVLRAVHLSSRLGSLARIPEVCWLAAMLVLVWAWKEGRLRAIEKVALVGFVVGEMMAALGAGALYLVATPLIAALGLLMMKSRRVPWLTVTVAILALIVVNVVKADFRVQRKAGTIQGDTISMGVAFLDLAAGQARQLDVTQVGISSFRFDRVTLLGYLDAKVPSRYPYWNGYSYRNAPYAVVPRVLVPWKPRFTLGNEFGRAFGFLDPQDRTTSENSPLVAEAFVNYGRVGMAVVAVLSGLVLAFAARATRGSPLSVAVVGAITATELIGGIESGITAVLFAWPIALVAGWTVRWITAPGAASVVDLTDGLGSAAGIGAISAGSPR